MSVDILDQIQFRLQEDDVSGAVELAKGAYLNNNLHPLVLNLVAHGLECAGDLEGALRVLGESVAQSPDDPMTYTNVGHCLVKLARPTHAIEAFNQALRINPNLPRAHHGVGLAFWMRGELEAGDEAHFRALQIDPNYPDPYGALAVAFAQRRDMERARAFAAKALSLNPHEIQAQMLEADWLFADGKVAESVDAQRRLLADPSVAPLQRVVINRRLGNGLDRLKQYGDAFAAYKASAEGERRIYQDLFEADDLESQPDKCRELAAYFRATRVAEADYAQDFAKNGVREHVFVMSFPRSGTTLLEQVLASHPDIVALEERPTLRESIGAYFSHSREISTLMNASEEELQPWRDLYWSRVAEFLGEAVAGKVFVDKQPSLTPYIPLIKRLFPNAKILFCIRDPRDVVLSCFRHGFTMNANMYEYTDIFRLARLYSLTMDCASAYFETLKPQYYLHKHEDLVEHFEEKSKALCAFLGVDYNQNMQNFAETAKTRDINTPSRDQVRAGLNARGVGYWRNYAAQMEEPARILAPWVEAYGYAP